jgi:AraC-like DNA-binding protein
VAAAMKISVRQLYLLFEPTGTSFAEHVLGRRLEECRAALESPSGRGRSVTDVAYAWGFNSLTTFYQALANASASVRHDASRLIGRERKQPRSTGNCLGPSSVFRM